MKVNIQYFAKIREERGCSHETFETRAISALNLYKELQVKYKFSLNYEYLKVAINDEFCDWDVILNNNDTVVFIQPVAGG